jgi:hypothetical protein
MSEHTILGRISEPRRDKMRGGRKKMNNQELHKMCPSLSITGIINSRKLSWIGQCRARQDVDEVMENEMIRLVACKGRKELFVGILLGRQKESAVKIETQV